MAMSDKAPVRFLKNSWMGTWSASLTRELATATKMDKPQPARKYIHGLPLLSTGSDLSFFQPRERQNGESRRTASVT